MEENNDGGSKEAEGKIRVAEFTGQKAAQPERGHSGRLLDDVTRRWERSGGGGGEAGGREVGERGRGRELFQESKLPEVKVFLLLHMQVTDS